MRPPVAAGAVVDALEDMKLAFPKVSAAQRTELEAARKALESEKKGK